MHGICMVYVWYIPVIYRPQRYVRYIPSKNLMGLFSTFFYNDIPLLYYVYTKDIHSITRLYLFYNDMPLLYYLYPKNIHSITKVYHYKKRYRRNP
jgi:hypothetical protein